MKIKKALIIIDMFVRDIKGRRDGKSIIENQIKLINAFNKSKMPVIIVGGRKDGKQSKAPFNPVMVKLWGKEESKNSEDNKIVLELLNSKYDYYVHKLEYSAFFRTNLERICKKEKIKEIYIGGISAGVCLYFTAADAAMRGILPILITDASGSSSEKYHKKNINNFKEILGDAISTKEALKRVR